MFLSLAIAANSSATIPNAGPTPASAIQPILVLSSISGGAQELYVPLNSTGIEAYPDWNVTFLQPGSYSIVYNGSLLESGSATSGYTISHDFPMHTISVCILFAGSNYSFSHVNIIGQLSSTVTQYASVMSSFPGQNQYLSALPGQQGVLMYGNWNLSMYSSINSSYSVTVDSHVQYQGFILGHRHVSLNFSVSPVTVFITIGSRTFSFPDEIITTVPLQHYYGPKPPPLIYTAAQYESGLEKAFAASVFAILISILSVRKFVIEREKREVQVV